MIDQAEDLLLVESVISEHLESSCIRYPLVHRDVRSDCSEQIKSGSSSGLLVREVSSSAPGTSTE